VGHDGGRDASRGGLFDSGALHIRDNRADFANAGLYQSIEV
jgi:hypothetical protein